MCPFCYIPFVAATTTFLISLFGFEATHADELAISWGVSLVVSVVAFYAAKKLYKLYKNRK